MGLIFENGAESLKKVVNKMMQIAGLTRLQTSGLKRYVSIQAVTSISKIG